MTDSLPRAVAVTVAAPLFLGREAELRHLEDLIRRATAGTGGAVVLRGEAGIGKSALLDQVRVAATGARVLDVAGSEFETGFPYAGLHQLCRPLLDSLSGLAPPQRTPLQVAFGLAAGTPDVFQTGLAAGDLLAAVAQERPLVCLVDDAHWLDAATLTVLTFVARRLGGAPIAMIFTVREPAAASGLDDLPALPVAGLPERDARALLGSIPGGRLDSRVLSRILAEARGNADPTGDPDLLWPAARLIPEIDVRRDSVEAVGSGLVEFTTRVRFCHPIARSVVYHAATVRARYAAHRALAEVTDPGREPDLMMRESYLPGLTFDDVYHAAAWAAILVNVMVAEYFIIHRTRKPLARRQRMTRDSGGQGPGQRRAGGGRSERLTARRERTHQVRPDVPIVGPCRRSPPRTGSTASSCWNSSALATVSPS